MSIFCVGIIGAYLFWRWVIDGGKVGPSGIEPDHMDDAAWDYVFLRGAYPEGGHAVPEEKLAKLRREFEYWPVFSNFCLFLFCAK